MQNSHYWRPKENNLPSLSRTVLLHSSSITFWGIGGAEVVMLLNPVSKYLYNLYYIGDVESFNSYF